jgi:predicted RNA-binding Zn-ribbon protein involved in translation (DUF1610 family)
MRRLWTIACAVSFVLFAATMALWVRSDDVYDAGPFPREGTPIQFDSLNGEFAITWHSRSHEAHHVVHVLGANTEFTRERHYRQRIWFGLEEWWENQGSPRWLHISVSDPPPARRPFWRLDRLAGSQLDRRGGVLGLNYLHATFVFEPSSAIMAFRTIVVPYWMVALLTGVLPALRLARWQRRRARRARNQCLSCGYDLRASTHRCPECGTPVGTNATSASASASASASSRSASH